MSLVALGTGFTKVNVGILNTSIFRNENIYDDVGIAV
jgi:hypothetical protein